MSARWTLVSLSVFALACGQDYRIYDTGRGAGKGDAPSLETPTRTDTVVQTTVPAVDVLWVVDNSCSMLEEQDELAANFSAFIGFFLDSGLDWHIGVVSTDTDLRGHTGKLRPATGYRYLTPDTPTPDALFNQMVSLGTGGSAEERGLDAAWLAIAQPSADLQNTNDGFYREDASLHVVVISDEDDQSTRVSPFEFSDFMLNLKSNDDIPVTFSTIVGPTPSGCSNRNTDADPAPRYEQVAATVGGIQESICVSDWYPVLEQLGLQAAGLRDEYFLSEVPAPATIEITVTDETGVRYGLNLDELPEGPTLKQVCKKRYDTPKCFGFQYDRQRNSVQFPDFIPNAQATVEIEYELLSGQQYVEDAEGEGDTAEE